MAKSRMKGQQIKIWESNRNERLYTREQERYQEQQNDQSREDSYERQNNSKYELYNIQNRPQFQPRYANNGTRYFYNNQRRKNTYPQNRSIYEFQNRIRFNYNQNSRYPNPNNWFGKEENQTPRNSNRQQIEWNPKLPELTYNLKDGNRKRELENIEQEQALEKIKKLLTTGPILACPDFHYTFQLETDASDTGLGAVLTQNINNENHVIAFASRSLNEAEKNSQHQKRNA